MMLELQGQFLVAAPTLKDDYFYRTVIYLCEHNEQGSMGIVINQPTDLSLAELGAKMHFMMKTDRVYSDQLVLAGGPANVDRGFIVHSTLPNHFQHSYKINDNFMLTTSADVLDTFGTPREPEKYFVALGCASWQPGQLEREIRENSWLVVPASDSIMFELPYEERWGCAALYLGVDTLNFAPQVGHC